jgi:chromosome partitioning protein
MIPIVASMNQKGGSGKTTIVGLLAEYNALVMKRRVLLIDLDMQCNTTDQWVGMENAPDLVGGQQPPKHPDYSEELGINQRSSIADIFYGKPVLPFSSWLNEKTSEAGIVDIMCGHPQLLEEVNLKFTKKDDSIDERILNRLRDFLYLRDLQESYDIILLDTGPSRNPIFRSAMRASTHIIIPFKPEEKDIQGINAMLQILRQENFSRSNIKLKLIGLLPNMVRNTKLHETNLEKISKGYNSALFPNNSWLNHLTAFPERDIKGIRPKSIFELSKNNPAYQQALAMARYAEESIFNQQLIGV